MTESHRPVPEGIDPDRDATVDQRLRHVDPAADREPDVPALRAAITQAGGPALPLPTASGSVVALSASRSYSRSPWMLAAAAAAIFGIAAGSYALGGRNQSFEAAPAVSLTVEPSAVPGLSSKNAELADASGGSLSGTPAIFRDGGVIGDAATGKTWGYDSSGISTADQAMALAKALGVSGEPQQEDYGAWTVGPADYSGPRVEIYPGSTADLNYTNPSADPWVDSSRTSKTPDQTPPSDSAAIDAARAFLSTLGLDPQDWELSVPSGEGDGVKFVEAYRRVDGAVFGPESGVSGWYFSVSAEGIVNATGPMASVVELGDYPVISAHDAVERLNDPQFGSLPLDGGKILDLEMAPADMPTGPAVSPEAIDVKPGEPLPWTVDEVVITGAELITGQVTHQTADGAQAITIEPVYRLSGDDGQTWYVMAVADAGLTIAKR